MIHADIQIGIIYGGKGLPYAKTASAILQKMNAEGYPISPVLIDNSWKLGAGTIDDRIFQDLQQCSYYVIFLTKDIEYEPGKYTARPNVWLELGLALKNADRNHILCLATFPCREIGSSYLHPSDIASQMVGEINSEDYENDLKKAFYSLLKREKIVPNLASSFAAGLLKNEQYRTDYYDLFAEQELLALNGLSFTAQLRRILDTWNEEKARIEELDAQILFVFERIVFVSFFYQERLHDRLFELLSFDTSNDPSDEAAMAAVRIAGLIKDYIVYRKNPRYQSVLFAKNKRNAEGLQKEISILEKHPCNPVLLLMSYNYLGLAQLHMAQEYAKTVSNGTPEVKEHAYSALKCFDTALALVAQIGDRMGIMESYIYFNRARANAECCRYEEALLDFSDASAFRYQVAQSNKLPLYFCTNFRVKSHLAELEKLRVMHKFNKLSDAQLAAEVNTLRKEIDTLQTSSGIENLEIFGQFYREANLIIA